MDMPRDSEPELPNGTVRKEATQTGTGAHIHVPSSWEGDEIFATNRPVDELAILESDSVSIDDIEDLVLSTKASSWECTHEYTWRKVVYSDDLRISAQLDEEGAYPVGVDWETPGVVDSIYFDEVDEVTGYLGHINFNGVAVLTRELLVRETSSYPIVIPYPQERYGERNIKTFDCQMARNLTFDDDVWAEYMENSELPVPDGVKG